jgi:hypothetical protein
LFEPRYCITCGRQLVECDGEQRCPQGCAPAGAPLPELPRDDLAVTANERTPLGDEK